MNLMRTQGCWALAVSNAKTKFVVFHSLNSPRPVSSYSKLQSPPFYLFPTRFAAAAGEGLLVRTQVCSTYKTAEHVIKSNKMLRQAFCLQRSVPCMPAHHNSCYRVYARPAFMVQHINLHVLSIGPLPVSLRGPQHLGLLIWSINGPIYFPYNSLVSRPGRLLLNQLTQFRSLSSVTLSAYLFTTDLISSYYLQRWTSSVATRTQLHQELY